MHIKSLNLQNFRSWEKYHLDFNDITILIGPNGIGKTNIIEAIYLLATGRSWRTGRENEVILWNQDFSRIIAQINAQDKKSLEMILQRLATLKFPQRKMIKINGVKKRLTQLLGVVSIVLFSPEELQMVAGSPYLRRRSLDVLLCQADKKYTLALLDLGKILRGRNKLLYYIKIGQSKVDELAFWDEKLITLGSFIIKKRQGVIEKLDQKLRPIYEVISGEKESLKIKYLPSVQAKDFAQVLVSNREREIENTATLFGPHRDDFIFLLEGRDLTTFGSRGEFRSAVLSLKMAELSFLKENGFEPILLLDDIFSELDQNRRLHLAAIVKDQQTIITTTDLDHIEKGLREKAKIVEL